MRVKRPAWVMDDGRKFDPRDDAPNLPDELIVSLWDWEEGESLLVTPGTRGRGKHGYTGIDYNVLDYPETFELVAPHDGDSVFGSARDIGHDMKEQDPDDCQQWAWGAPWLTPGADEENGLWVMLQFCRPGFEDMPVDIDSKGEAVWEYHVYLLRGEADPNNPEDNAEGLEWPEARAYILDFMEEAGLPAPGSTPAAKRKSKGGKAALDVLNRHRRSIGMSTLDPKAAGWTDQDVLDEVDRLERSGVLRTNNPNKKMSKSNITRLRNSLMPFDTKDDGARAQQRGRPRSSCPYNERTTEGRRWLLGWDESRRAESDPDY